MQLKRLLVPVDFSRCSETAFRYAKFMAKKFSSDIYLIHVVDKRYVEKIAELNGEREEEVTRKLCLQAKDNIKRFLEKNESEGMVAEKTIAVGVPFQAIARQALTLHADMIIMGGHGRMGNGQLDKIFFGSKAEKIVRLLPCPVLCIPQEVVGIESAMK